LAKACSRDIANMPTIESEKVRRERSLLDVTAKGVLHEERARYESLGKVFDFETPRRPDVLRRLQESTGLLRKTLTDILVDSGRLKDFNINPELFIKHVSVIIRKLKREYMVDGIKYYKLDDFYNIEEVFDDSELYGYKNKNVLDISDEKNVYDHLIFDSEIEKMFAEDAEKDEDVIVYAKLPTKFSISTPYGNYSPDWIVLLRALDGDKLYFVAETKGSEDEDQLRQSEKAKILSGSKHFEVLDNGIKYELVKELKDLKNS
jgi:type III restriction enzyme